MLMPRVKNTATIAATARMKVAGSSGEPSTGGTPTESSSAFSPCLPSAPISSSRPLNPPMPAAHGHCPLGGIAAQAPALSKAANGSSVILSHQRSSRRSRISFQPQAAGASTKMIAARPRPCSAKSPT